jgi:hypothetical protein
LLVGHGENRLVVWNREGQILAESGEPVAVIHFQFTEKGDKFLLLLADGTITLRETSSLKTLLTTIITEKDGWVAAASDGRYDGEGKARQLLHYTANGEIVMLADFDKSFHTRGLVTEIISGKAALDKKNIISAEIKKEIKTEIAKSLAGKIHSVSSGTLSVAGRGFYMGEKLFVIVSGKAIHLKVTFPMLTSARVMALKTGEVRLLRPGMPVFRNR